MKIQYVIAGYFVLVGTYAVSMYVLSPSEDTTATTRDDLGIGVVPGESIPLPAYVPAATPAPAQIAIAEAATSHIEPRYSYIKITDGCSAYYEGACVNVRTGPGTTYPVIAKLRSGAVLRTEEKVTEDARDWYKVVFDEWLRYPERVGGSWYIAAEYVEAFENEGILEATTTTPTTTKSILIDRSEQKLYAYDGESVFMEESVSTGHETTPTPRGTFSIFRKTPSRYMQGPLPNISDDYYDLPGVPWNLYFTSEGAAIHGAYWHDKFGQRWSHGCVNLLPDNAQKLYEWADVGTAVTVRD